MNTHVDNVWFVIKHKDGHLAAGHMSKSPKLYKSFGIAKSYASGSDKVLKVKLSVLDDEQ